MEHQVGDLHVQIAAGQHDHGVVGRDELAPCRMRKRVAGPGVGVHLVAQQDLLAARQEVGAGVGLLVADEQGAGHEVGGVADDDGLAQVPDEGDRRDRRPLIDGGVVEGAVGEEDAGVLAARFDGPARVAMPADKQVPSVEPGAAGLVAGGKRAVRDPHPGRLRDRPAGGLRGHGVDQAAPPEQAWEQQERDDGGRRHGQPADAAPGPDARTRRLRLREDAAQHRLAALGAPGSAKAAAVGA